MFAVYWAITLVLIGFALIRMATTDQLVPMLLRALGYCLYALAPLANLIFFFLVSHTLCLSYDDWTAKMIAASESDLLSVDEVLCLISASHALCSASIIIGNGNDNSSSNDRALCINMLVSSHACSHSQSDSPELAA